MFNDARNNDVRGMRRALAILLLLPLLALPAGCTPVPEEEPMTERCGLLDGPECRRSVPGDLPAPWTDIGKLAGRCAKPQYCGPVGYVDCGSAVDGPAYYFERESGKVIGY